MSLQRMGSQLLLGVVLCGALSTPALAATFTVNRDDAAAQSAGFSVHNAPNATTGGYCDVNPAADNQGLCTLTAAIEVANAVAGFDTIKFQGLAKVTLLEGLPHIIERVVIDGTSGSGPRLEVDGNGSNACFSASGNGYVPGNGPPLVPQANNSRFESLVVHNCSGTGISLGGHGYVVSDSYIGVKPDGETASPNRGEGIFITASLQDGGLGNLPSVPLPDKIGDLGGIVTFLLSVVPNLAPNAIVNNVISGNDGHGIEISGQYSAANIVFDNRIGTNAGATAPVPNGGGSGDGHGIVLRAGTYANFIGLDNVIAGNNDGGSPNDGIGDPLSYGILLSAGAVPFPNFVLGNFVGTSLQSAFLVPALGNARSGIFVGSDRPTTADDVNTVPNPLGLAAIIGPGNIVGYNGVDEDVPAMGNTNGDVAGIMLGGADSVGVRVFGNVVGMSENAVGAIDIGNRGDGINVTGRNHEIGGETKIEGNIVGANARHGIVVRGGSSAFGVRVHGNAIGTLPFGDGAEIGNDGNGLWVISGGNTLGVDPVDGEGDEEGNRIAYNGRHGIQLTGGDTWSNLIRKNEIFGIPEGFLGIDLDNPANAPDVNESPSDDRTSLVHSYTNWQQNSVVLSLEDGGGITYALASAPNGSYRVEFYKTDGTAGGKEFICEQNVATDASGMASGAACASGGPGVSVTATVTDLRPTDSSAGEPMPPGAAADGPANNTSEFSLPATAPDEIAFSQASYVVAENEGVATIIVSRTGSGAASITLALTDVTTGSEDHGALSSTTLTWAAGDPPDQQVTLPIVADLIDEPNETLTLDITIDSADHAVIGTPGSATVVITDVNPPAVLSIAGAGTNEGGQLVFTVTRTGATAFTTSAAYAVTPGAGTEAADIAAGDDPLTGTISIAPDQTTATISVLAVDDAIHEPAEDVIATLSAPVNATLVTATATATIAASDDPPVLSIDSPTTIETDANAPLAFTVTKTGETELPATVGYAVSPGTATTPEDYIAGPDPLTGTLSFAPGETMRSITLTVVGDDIDEPGQPETFSVTLADPVDASLGIATGTGTIIDDDGSSPVAGTVQFSGASYSVGEAGGSATITVTRSGGSDGAVSVQYATSDGSATAGSDYNPTSGTLNWADGDAGSKTFMVPILDDSVDEPDETVILALTTPGGGAALGSPATAMLTIVDDDPSPVAGTLQFSSASYSVGEAGGSATITVIRSGGSDGAVSVQYATSDGSATAGSDYTTASGTLNWADGDAGSKTFTVPILDDSDDEPDETVMLTLAAPGGGAALGSPATAMLTIIDDDPSPVAGTLQFSSASYSVGEAGGSATITVTRSGGSDGAVSVQYATSNGSATAGSDYTAASGTLSWADGDAGSKTFTVAILDDGDDEADETITLTLTAPGGGAGLGSPAAAVLTIVDDDNPSPVAGTLQFSSASYSVGEASGGATITVTRGGGSDGAVSVQYATSNGSATAGSDYTAASGTLNWADGDAGSKTFTVAILDDSDDESDETVTLTLTAPGGGAGFGSPAAAVLTIVDDDNPSPVAGTLQFSSASYSVAEAGGNATITLTRAGGSDGAVSVQYATSNGSATAGSDFTAVSGTLNWADGDAGSKTFTVAILDDSDDESDETVMLTLTAPGGGAALGSPAVAVLTIVDDDNPSPAAGTLQFSSASYSVGEAGGSATITVTRSGGSDSAVSVQYATSNGSATAGSDYTAASDTLNWADGDAGSKTFTVAILDDSDDEADETITLTLTAPGGGAALGSPATAMLTIVDDDNPSPVAGTLQFSSASYSVGEASGSATITVTRAGGSDGPISVQYATSDGSATAGSDYTAVSGTLNWADGDAGSKTFTVAILDDSDDEPDETLMLTLTAPGGGAALGSPATVVLTIVDDDAAGPIPYEPPLAVALLDGNGRWLMFVLLGVFGTMVLRRRQNR